MCFIANMFGCYKKNCYLEVKSNSRDIYIIIRCALNLASGAIT